MQGHRGYFQLHTAWIQTSLFGHTRGQMCSSASHGSAVSGTVLVSLHVIEFVNEWNNDRASRKIKMSLWMFEIFVIRINELLCESISSFFKGFQSINFIWFHPQKEYVSQQSNVFLWEYLGFIFTCVTMPRKVCQIFKVIPTNIAFSYRPMYVYKWYLKNPMVITVYCGAYTVLLNPGAYLE